VVGAGDLDEPCPRDALRHLSALADVGPNNAAALAGDIGPVATSAVLVHPKILLGVRPEQGNDESEGGTDHRSDCSTGQHSCAVSGWPTALRDTSPQTL
jgi:hypothetical protein